MDAKQASALRAPFPPSAIGHLPKGGVVLDFVGHAATTDRLLQVDPDWSWAPLAHGQDGLPQFDQHGGLWITLTVAGVTRLGYGDAAGKKGANAVKEAIGDAIRNGAMRFGVALDLWTKEDLHAVEESPSAPAARPAATRSSVSPPADVSGADGDEHKRARETKSTLDVQDPDREVITKPQRDKVIALAGPKGWGMTADQLRDVIDRVTAQRALGKVKRYQFDALLAAVDLEGRGGSA